MSVKVKWRPWEKEWNKAVKALYNSGQWTFTRPEIYTLSGHGKAGRTLWDTQRWPTYVAKHRDIIEQVMEAFVGSGDYEKRKAQGMSDDDIWEAMINRAVDEGYYPVWADPTKRKPGDPGIYKLFDLDGFTELMMRGVRAGIKRAENVGRDRYLPAKQLYPSVVSKARGAFGMGDARPVLTDGAQELTRIACDWPGCERVCDTQKDFAIHYAIHLAPGQTSQTP